jgi:hypothetical protein
VAGDYAADRSGEEADCVRAKSEQRTRERRILREEQLVEDQGSRGSVEEEVVPLDGGAYHACEGYLPDRGLLPFIFAADPIHQAMFFITSLAIAIIHTFSSLL